MWRGVQCQPILSFGNSNIAMLETCQKLSIRKFSKFISTFLDQNELSQTTQSRQVSGAGGINSDRSKIFVRNMSKVEHLNVY